MKYKIKVKETLERIVEVDADSLELALEKVSEQYDNEEIVLSADDFTTLDIFLDENVSE